MSKIFIDTNILVSAIIFDGNELEVILESYHRGDKVYISEHILEEATRVFLKKFPEHIELFETFIEISEITIIKKEVYSNNIIDIKGIRDKYDAHVIACAKKLNCDHVITGDKDILSYTNTNDDIDAITSFDYLSLM